MLNESRQKGHTFWDFCYIKCLVEAKLQRTDRRLPGAGCKSKVNPKASKETSGEKKQPNTAV